MPPSNRMVGKSIDPWICSGLYHPSIPPIVPIATAQQNAMSDRCTFSERIPINVIEKIKIEIQKGEKISMVMIVIIPPPVGTPFYKGREIQNIDKIIAYFVYRHKKRPVQNKKSPPKLGRDVRRTEGVDCYTATGAFITPCDLYPMSLKSSHSRFSISSRVSNFLLIFSSGRGRGSLVSCSFTWSIWLS